MMQNVVDRIEEYMQQLSDAHIPLLGNAIQMPGRSIPTNACPRLVDLMQKSLIEPPDLLAMRMEMQIDPGGTLREYFRIALQEFPGWEGVREFDVRMPRGQRPPKFERLTTPRYTLDVDEEFGDMELAALLIEITVGMRRGMQQAAEQHSASIVLLPPGKSFVLLRQHRPVNVIVQQNMFMQEIVCWTTFIATSYDGDTYYELYPPEEKQEECEEG